MRWLPAALAVCALGQEIRVEPLSVLQGGVIRVSGAAAAARMSGRFIRLFPQQNGGALGLMPVSAIEKPGVLPLEILDGASKPVKTVNVTIRDARFPKQDIRLGPRTRQLRPAPGELEAAGQFRKLATDVRHWQEPFARPVPGCMSSRYGVTRLHNGKPTGDYHGGLDQRAPAGQPIHAIAGGIVRLVLQGRLMGNTVGIDHGQGLESMYLHLSRFAVREGDQVNKGDVIGYVGATGRVTGPHLHWSFYVNGVPVNPLAWIAVKPCGVSANRVTRRRK